MPQPEQIEALPEVTEPHPDGCSYQYQTTMTILLVYLNPQLLTIDRKEPVIQGWLRRFGIIGEKSPAGDESHPHRHSDEDDPDGGRAEKY